MSVLRDKITMLNRLKIKLQWRGQSLYAAFALTLAFTACSSSQIDEAPKDSGEQLAQTSSSAAETPQTPAASFDPDSFTTEGKPTKTIETPWGPREVYDPSKDVEVLLAIEEIYNRGDVFYGDVHKVSPVRPVKSDKLRSVQLVRHVRRIQDLDMRPNFRTARNVIKYIAEKLVVGLDQFLVM